VNIIDDYNINLINVISLMLYEYLSYDRINIKIMNKIISKS
jgi:hypothetical protein